MDAVIEGGALRVDGVVVLRGVSARVSCVVDEMGVGVFLRVRRVGDSGDGARWKVGLGRTEVERWMGCCRVEPFWMVPRVGGRGSGEVGVETQVLFGELGDGRVVLVVPLVDVGAGMRCSLEGGVEGEVRVVVESGSERVVADEVVGVFVAVGSDVGELCRRGAGAVRGCMGAPGRVSDARSDRLPNMLRGPCPEHGTRDGAGAGFLDLFGWCTWDAFYQEVSAERVREGLESFRRGGVVPKLVILDDGWQEVRDLGERRGKRLCGFGANEKFGGGLREVIGMAKGEFGVERFFVWHAMGGYRGGVDLEGFAAYGVEERERRYSEGVHHYVPTIESWWGTSAGVVEGDQAGRFFEDYHARLRAEGVDGVKVDVQASLESVCGSEGRVGMYEKFRRGLEGSVGKFFGDGLINCMSCANDIVYGMRAGSVMRTSTDFWPTKPETHGLHVWTNGGGWGLWFGEFVVAGLGYVSVGAGGAGGRGFMRRRGRCRGGQYMCRISRGRRIFWVVAEIGLCGWAGAAV